MSLAVGLQSVGDPQVPGGDDDWSGAALRRFRTEECHPRECQDDRSRPRVPTMCPHRTSSPQSAFASWFVASTSKLGMA